MSQPPFIPMFQDVQAQLQAHAISEVKPFDPKMSPEALVIYAQDLYDLYQRTRAMLVAESQRMGRTLEMTKDLQLAKEPDVERIAEALLITGTAETPQAAYSKARAHVTYRNEQRRLDYGPSGVAKR